MISIVLPWVRFKDVLVDTAGISRDALHVGVGLSLFAVAATCVQEGPAAVRAGCS